MLNARWMPLWTVLPLSFLAACGSGKDAPDAKGKGNKRTPRFAAVELSLQSFSAPHTVLGAVRAAEAVEIRTEVAGRLSALPFAEGAPVRKGQVLARLDDAEARASRDRSAARSRLADATLARVREQ
jgi:multidrug efflux pump subunit AcrA (membrane-fusion protein)